MTPLGHLLWVDGGGEGAAGGVGDRELGRLRKAFGEGTAEGLFALAVSRVGAEAGGHPSLAYWREFAGRFVGALCRRPEVGLDGDGAGHGAGLGPVEPPAPAELAELFLSAPPMRGGEYLRPEVLGEIWSDLDTWVGAEVAGSGLGLSAWLEKRAPLWRQVGRVCFHLAENKRDPEHPFAFLATYAPGVSKGGRVQFQPLSKALQQYASARDKATLVRLLEPVHRASEVSALAQELVDTGDLYHPLAWTPGQAHRFLQDASVLEESGLLVRLPDWWRKRPRPRVRVSLGDLREVSCLGTDSLLKFQVGVALGGGGAGDGGGDLTEAELEELRAARDGLVFLRGRWVEVDRDKLDQALAHWRKVEKDVAGGGLSFAEGMRLLAGAPADLRAGGQDDEVAEWSSVEATGELANTLAALRDPERCGGARPGKALRGTLRPYQEVGLQWLWTLSRLGLGACLADDMGLGKTVQVIALLLAAKKTAGGPQPSLLVLPASLLANWKAELEAFAPSLRVRFIHPSETPKEELKALAADPAAGLRGIDAALTTYGMLARNEWMREAVDWHLVVLDEAQAIKNPGARQTRAVKQLRADARIALTGTPVENRLSDLWSLFDFLCPGLLGSVQRFRAYAKSLAASPAAGSNGAGPAAPGGRYAPLRNLVSPYILRRLKTDKSIISDLPDKTEVKAHCGLGKRQAALYGATVDELAGVLENAEGIGRRGLVLAYLMKFKQICNHPDQALGHGGYPPADSGKADRLRAIAEEIASRQEKLLVFTQFREMTTPLADWLAEVFGRPGLVLHGGTAVKKRRAAVEAFQDEAGPPFFVLSLKAGGTGLNLTAAAHVVHFDRWWNPAVENQATDRAFRIGQKRNVLVHKFICRGTVEEKIDALIEEKTGLAQDLLGDGAGGETLLTEMGDAELLATVSLDLEKAAV